MECNMVSPSWDWDHLIIPNLSKTESDKKQPSSDWDIEKGEGIESIFPSFASSTTTGFLHTPVSKNSQLTSTNSSSPKLKRSSCGDFDQVKASSTALEVSAGSDLCLKLGKRSYSDEEFWGGRNDNSDVSAVSVKLLTPPPVVAQKKSKPSCGQSMQVPRCQIDGCELDLSSAKDYHRKHRVCENHSKCPVVTVGGMERRFCQQCSRLHAVSEFDEKKRSCRKRLSHHNARRRKPQGVFPLHPERVYNRRQHTNKLWNELSLNTRSEEKYAWGTSYDSKPTQRGSGFTLSFQRGNGAEEQVFASSNLSFSAYQTSGGFSTGKSNFQLPGKGVEEYSGGLHETQDFYSALSLLSTSSDSHGTKHHPMVESLPVHGTFPSHFI
ncbi:SBP domain-containing protein [Hirschfeldia incana]|nr:SBP domain-containing protein [Hirschfeldia incana]KAJ0235435.1 SBP domain-containing protein [Hirschfeldia incana]